jgi:hypothetical protein
LNTHAIAVPIISSSICSLASPPSATSPSSPRYTLLPSHSSPTLSKTDVTLAQAAGITARQVWRKCHPFPRQEETPPDQSASRGRACVTACGA